MHLKKKDLFRLCIVLVLSCILGFLVTGCAISPDELPESQKKPPAVKLGPILYLLTDSTGQDKVKVISDAAGCVHVLIASTSLKQIVDVTVWPDGVTKLQGILSNISPASIDGILDDRGRLHILIDSEHIVFEDGKGCTSEPTVWQKDGFTVEKPGFVRGTKDLVWTFIAHGENIGAVHGRWVLRGGGGGYPGGAFLIWPWHEKTRKAVMVPGSAENDIPWNIIDPSTKADSTIVDAVSDAIGNVHLIFAAGNNVHLVGKFSFLDELSFRKPGEFTMYYARVEANELKSCASRAPDMPKEQKAVRQFRAINGGHQLSGKRIPITLPLAVDPITGTVLIGDLGLIRNDRWREIDNFSSFMFRFPIQIAAAGNDTFHAIAFGNIDERFMGRSGIVYSMFSECGWSAPVWLSVAGTLPLFYEPAVSMANIGNGNAFVAWSTDKGVVGRWIERTQ